LSQIFAERIDDSSIRTLQPALNVARFFFTRNKLPQITAERINNSSIKAPQPVLRYSNASQVKKITRNFDVLPKNGKLHSIKFEMYFVGIS
jgi:hypothetical protein